MSQFVSLPLLAFFVSLWWCSGLQFCSSHDLFFRALLGSFVHVYSIWQESGQRTHQALPAEKDSSIPVNTFFFIGLQVPLPSPFTHTHLGFCQNVYIPCCHPVSFSAYTASILLQEYPAFQQTVIPEAMCYIQIWGYQSHLLLLLYYTWNNVWNSLGKTVENIIFNDRCF